MKKVVRVLVVQRISLSNGDLKSRSIGARFFPLLKYLQDANCIEWGSVSEDQITLLDLKKFDVMLFNKHTSKEAVRAMQLANENGLKTVYDLDDWILDLPQYSVTELTSDKLENIMWLIRNATVATVSNKMLFHKISKIRKSVVIMRNGIDPLIFHRHKYGIFESATPKILFSNTDGVKLVKYKDDFFSLLNHFLKINPDVEIDFWGDTSPEILNISRINPRGFLDNHLYKEALASEGYWFSIVPLGGAEDIDTLFFNSCKSCIKYVDYGAIGIPGIYSNSPVYSEVIRSRFNGILVNNDSTSWGAGLNELLKNSSLRNEIRKNAYLDVKKNHSIEEPAKIFLNLIRT